MNEFYPSDDDGLGYDSDSDQFQRPKPRARSSMDALAVVGGAGLRMSLTSLIAHDNCQWDLISPASPTSHSGFRSEEEEVEEATVHGKLQEQVQQQAREAKKAAQVDRDSEMQRVLSSEAFQNQEATAQIVLCEELLSKYNDKDMDVESERTGTQTSSAFSFADSDLLDVTSTSILAGPLVSHDPVPTPPREQIRLNGSTERIPFYDDSSSEDEQEHDQDDPSQDQHQRQSKVTSSPGLWMRKSQTYSIGATAKVQQVYRKFRSRTSSGASPPEAPSTAPAATTAASSSDEDADEDATYRRRLRCFSSMAAAAESEYRRQQEEEEQVARERVSFWSNPRDSFRDSISSRLSVLRCSASSLGSNRRSLLPSKAQAKAKAASLLSTSKAEASRGISSAVKTLKPRFPTRRVASNNNKSKSNQPNINSTSDIRGSVKSMHGQPEAEEADECCPTLEGSI